MAKSNKTSYWIIGLLAVGYFWYKKKSVPKNTGIVPTAKPALSVMAPTTLVKTLYDLDYAYQAGTGLLTEYYRAIGTRQSTVGIMPKIESYLSYYKEARLTSSNNNFNGTYDGLLRIYDR